jgi:hypothetical protein
MADGAGNLSIRLRLADRDPLQEGPDAPLEGGALHVERQFSRRSLTRHELDQRENGRRELAEVARDRCRRVLAAKILFERLGGVAQLDAADAALGCANQQVAERRANDDVVDVHAKSSAAIRVRRHAEFRVRAFVEPAARPVPCLVEGRRDRLVVPEQRLQAAGAQRVSVLLR